MSNIVSKDPRVKEVIFCFRLNETHFQKVQYAIPQWFGYYFYEIWFLQKSKY